MTDNLARLLLTQLDIDINFYQNVFEIKNGVKIMPTKRIFQLLLSTFIIKKFICKKKIILSLKKFSFFIRLQVQNFVKCKKIV